MIVPDGAECGRCFGVRFENAINGTGKVPVWNLIVAGDNSYLAKTTNCEICIVEEPVFVRGDCNFDGEVDVSDPAAIVSFLFAEGTWKFPPVCIDACDTNDDGRLDLADAHATLFYNFNMGYMIPPPGPLTPGVDPTDDKLDCEVDPCPLKLP